MKMQIAIIPTDLLFVVVIPDFLVMVLFAQVHIILLDLQILIFTHAL
jgi:hypothetical protein